MQSLSTQHTHWSYFEKIAFKFFFIYFSLFIIFLNNGAYPFFNIIMEKPHEWLESIIIWVGENILKLPEVVSISTGSGDTSFDYVLIFCLLIVAVVGAIVWTLFDKNKKSYSSLYYWLTLGIRFYIAFMLINYGYIKILKLQFPDPSFNRLITPYGQSSPMGLAWTFLGFSKGYNIFIGVAEILSGLLLFRRTMTAGAIITLLTAINIAAINYFYDVPVKILSSHLVFLTLFLLARNFSSLYKFFFTDNPVKLEIQKTYNLKNQRLRPIFNVVKILFIAYFLISSFVSTKKDSNSHKDFVDKIPLYGLYEVSVLQKNNETITPNNVRTKTWKYIIIEYENSMQIINSDRTYLNYKTENGPLENELIATNNMDSTDIMKLKFFRNDPAFILDAVIQNDTIRAYGSTLEKEDFLLMNRGFNWVNERPLNR